MSMVAKITRKGLEKHIKEEMLARVGDEVVVAKHTHFELYHQPKHEDDLTIAEQAFTRGFVSYGKNQPFHAVYTDADSDKNKYIYINEIKHGDMIKLPINLSREMSYRAYRVYLSS